MGSGIAELHGPTDALHNEGGHADRHRRTDHGHKFRPSNGRIPLDLRFRKPLCRGCRRPDQPQMADRRIAAGLVPGHLPDGLLLDLRTTLLATGPDGRERGSLHPGGSLTDRRLSYGPVAQLCYWHPHDGALSGTGPGRIRSHDRRKPLLAGDVPRVRHHRHCLCPLSDSVPA